MSTSAIIGFVVALLATGGLLAARAGIRSLQRARKVVFYRTRKAYMLAGWQWLVLALILFSSTVASALFGEPVASQIFPPTAIPIDLSVSTPPPDATLAPISESTDTPVAMLTPEGTSTPSAAFTQNLTASPT